MQTIQNWFYQIQNTFHSKPHHRQINVWEISEYLSWQASWWIQKFAIRLMTRPSPTWSSLSLWGIDTNHWYSALLLFFGLFFQCTKEHVHLFSNLYVSKRLRTGNHWIHFPFSEGILRIFPPSCTVRSWHCDNFVLLSNLLYLPCQQFQKEWNQPMGLKWDKTSQVWKSREKSKVHHLLLFT